ncbi:MAG: hypothetical protein KO206_00980 [Methanomicrobiaceae archaeon]|uniref:Uncharacterized protein n=1 Tax=hydrocarbon metagenome TaxID=938273 RepID=A0A0W8FID9_9ZZZZ|nr:hypothetical protein [Methanomicrobiaceae archaeon]MDD5418889.1 hypothetical protein [Methanomicrobiaceae archaeon]
MPPCRDIVECEERIRCKEYEVAYIFLDHHTLLKGGITQRYIFGVGFSEEEFALMQNNILTHNHTGEYTNSFSLGDVAKAAEANLKEIRIAGKRFTYSLAPGDRGWPPPDAIRAKYREIEGDYGFYLHARIAFLGIASCEQIPPDAGSRFFNHLIWERLAREMGLRYLREPWPRRLTDSGMQRLKECI